MPLAVPRRCYDHAFRNAVCEAQDPGLFDDIPLETQRTWLRRGPANVVLMAPSEHDLLIRVRRLQRQVEVLRNVVRLLLALVRIHDLKLDATRVPSEDAKRVLMRAVRQAAKHMP